MSEQFNVKKNEDPKVIEEQKFAELGNVIDEQLIIDEEFKEAFEKLVVSGENLETFKEKFSLFAEAKEKSEKAFKEWSKACDKNHKSVEKDLVEMEQN